MEVRAGEGEGEGKGNIINVGNLDKESCMAKVWPK